MTSGDVRELALACGFELAGVAAAEPLEDRIKYAEWVAAGFAGEMRYLTDRRGPVRDDPRNLLPSARSVICAGKLYNGPRPYSTEFTSAELGWISRYAWGEDYHDVVRRGLVRLDHELRARAGPGYESKACIDTAPLLERSYARQAGLGWIGRNSCLISQEKGSWFFLGELLVSIAIGPDAPPPDRCGTCRLCIDACPTAAIVPPPSGVGYAVDSRRCISYLTIELRGPIPADLRSRMGQHLFGCDICQDVCPWNRNAAVTAERVFDPVEFAPPLAKMAALSHDEFRAIFGKTPVSRARYSGFLRNVAVAMGNSGLEIYREALEGMANGNDPQVSDHARWALGRLGGAHLTV